MMLIAQVMRNTHDNDDEKLPFITLGAATLNVVRFLEGSDKHQGDRERDTPRKRTEEEKARDHAEAVNQRLRDTAEFERRFDPGYRSTRKRN